MPEKLQQVLERSPIIAAVFDTADLDTAIESPCEIVFLLGGNICNLANIIERVHEKGKQLFVHFDLHGGIGKDQCAVQYLKENFSMDGIITTKSNISKYARDCGVMVIQRFFMLDSKSFESAVKALQSGENDAVEILPGVIPGIISQISRFAKVPVIAGGLIRSKKDAIDSLNAGAMGVSTSCKEVWYM